MRILITNDDGYQSKGIQSLVKIMKEYGDVTVVAPKQHQSGMSMAVSIGYKPVVVKDMGVVDGVHWHYVDGTPASAAKYAMDMLFVDEKPDLVLSGINHGSNASTAMWYSGTIGAAREAAMLGVPAIGVSLDNMSRDADFTVVEQLLPGILDKLLAHLPADHTPLYNINFPDLPASQIKGVKVCSQGVERWEDEFVTPDQLGRVEEVELEEGEVLYFMAGDVVPSPLNSEDTDNWANDNGYVAITPQDLDNTHWADFENLKTIF